MPLSCQACHRPFFPESQLQTWQEQIKRLPKTSPNTYIADSPSIRRIVTELFPYAESLRKELEAINRVLQPALELSAPMTKLSDDILLCIFQELFPIEIHGIWTRSRDVHTFTLVCKRWRNIIISTPKFWTRISLPYKSRYTPLDSLPTSLSLQISRAGGTLPLALDWPRPLMYRDISYSSQPIVDRIIYLSMETDHKNGNEALGICSALPKLERLSFTVSEYSPPSDDGMNFDEVSEPEDWSSDYVTIDLPQHMAPFLTNVELIINGRGMEGITLPWAQLTILTITHEDESDYDPCCIVTELQKIEELRLNLNVDCMDYPSAAGRLQITLPYLRTLALNGRGDDDFRLQLLQQSKMPSLKELSLTLISGNLDFVAAMGNPQLWTIVDLQLEVETFSSDDALGIEEVMNCLWEFKCLERFSCNVNWQKHFAGRIYQVLSRNDSSRGWLFPRLTTAGIIQVIPDEDLLPPLHELLRNRVSSVDVPAEARLPLRTVHLSIEPRPDPWANPSSPLVHASAKQIFKPIQYNDTATSVTIEALGLPLGFLDKFVHLDNNVGGSL